jgi:hypothetical protein
MRTQVLLKITAMPRTTAATNGLCESAVAGVAVEASVSVPAGVGCALKAARRLQDPSTATAGHDSATATAGAGTGVFNGGSSCAAAAAAIRRLIDG